MQYIVLLFYKVLYELVGLIDEMADSGRYQGKYVTGATRCCTKKLVRLKGFRKGDQKYLCGISHTGTVMQGWNFRQQIISSHKNLSPLFGARPRARTHTPCSSKATICFYDETV